MGKGITAGDVFEAADHLLADGGRPTIERVRQHLGRGSPNTVNRHLDAWWSTLASRMKGGNSNTTSLPAALLELCGRLYAALQSQALAEARIVVEEGMAARDEDRANVERMVESVKAEKLAVAQTVEKLREDLSALRLRNEGLISDRARLSSELESARKETDTYCRRVKVIETEVQSIRADWAADVARVKQQSETQQSRWLREIDALREERKRSQTEGSIQLSKLQGHISELNRTIAASSKEKQAASLELKKLLETGRRERELRISAEASAKAATKLLTRLTQRGPGKKSAVARQR